MADINPFEPAAGSDDPFALRDKEDFLEVAEKHVHVFRGHVCSTEEVGRQRSPLDLVVDATEGFIPLWQKDMTLRWRFQERSLLRFRNPEALKTVVRELFQDALRAWGEAAPIRFSEQDHACDFEVAVRNADDCSPYGCTLASAFFPGEGQNELTIYPKMFGQVREEQVETLAHEIGHIFGLRHFFAVEREGRWPVEIFGAHRAESIMNYGDLSTLTDYDRSDLATLYQLVWSGQMTNINRTPIRLMRPYSFNRP